MKLLAVDTSGLVASVAIVTNEALLAEYTVNYKKTHSQTLLPMLNEIITMIELDLKQIDGIAVASGPGSFTGLRIGSATVKGIGQALDKPIIPVPTIDAMAYNLYGTEKLICPMIDARRRQVYTGIYEFVGSSFNVVSDQKVVSIEDIVHEVDSLKREVIYLGEGSYINRDYIIENTKAECYFAPAHMNRQRAGAVGALGLIYYKEGKYESASNHVPVYMRLSQAERVRKERQTKDTI